MTLRFARSGIAGLTALFAILALLTVPLGAQAAGQPPGDSLGKIIDDYEAFVLKENPFRAGRKGDLDALSRLPALTAEDLKRRLEKRRAFLSRLEALEAGALDEDARFNRDLLTWLLRHRIAQGEMQDERLPFTSLRGFHTRVQAAATETPIRKPAHAEAWLSRLRDVPRYLAENRAHLKHGIETGWTQPKGTAEIAIGQVERTLATPAGESAFYEPFDKLPESWSEAEKERLRADAIDVIGNEIMPAYRELLAFLKDEYLPNAREQLGIRSIPGGEEYYRELVSFYTTLDLSPEDIHEIGQAEVARIRSEMDRVIEETGFDGDFEAFQTFLRTDPQFYASSAEELVRNNRAFAKRVDGQMPEYFGTLPRLPYAVIEMPAVLAEFGTTAFYNPGNPDRGVAGIYYVNTTKLDQRPLYEIPALTIHEAVPGHHHQIALSQEIAGAPDFRERLYVVAFVEGWALYTESLGYEMDLYDTPYDEFGQLSYEMWRACRLVADTGIHWLGFSRAEAEACFHENTALSPANIEAEVDRYISYPGQALGYKMGQLKISELRARAEQALGENFDVRAFHDVILVDGAMPLTMLEARVDAWIDGKKNE